MNKGIPNVVMMNYYFMHHIFFKVSHCLCVWVVVLCCVSHLFTQPYKMQLYGKLGPVVLQYIIVIVANFNLMTLSIGLAWNSPVLVELRNENQTVLNQPITEKEGAWITSIASIGSLSIFLMGYLIDKFGRKYIIIFTSVPRFIMCILSLFATDVWMLYVAKFFCGIADVLTLTAVPTYASEIASTEIRGTLGTITQILSALGALMILSIGPFVSYGTLNVICTCCTVLLFIPQLFLPESPYFLYVKGKHNDCVKLLTLLRGSEEKALEEIKDYALIPAKTSKKEIFRDKTLLKTLGIVLFLASFIQLVGYNVLSSYMQTILESTHTTIMPEVASAVIGCIQLVGSLCAMFSADRFGRKVLLIVNLFGMAVGMAVLGTFFKISEYNFEITGFLNFVPLISLTLTSFCFNAGLGSIVWMLIAELFDGPSRAFGVSTGVFTSIIFIFITNQYFTTIIESIGAAATYWILAVNCTVYILFILFIVPETKGKSFSEIQASLGRSSKISLPP